MRLRLSIMLGALLCALTLSLLAQPGLKVGTAGLEPVGGTSAVQYPFYLGSTAMATTGTVTLALYNGATMSASNGPAFPVVGSGQVVSVSLAYKTADMGGLRVSISKNGTPTTVADFAATTGTVTVHSETLATPMRFASTDKITVGLASMIVGGTLSRADGALGIVYDSATGTAETGTLYKIVMPASVATGRTGYHSTLAIYFADGVAYTRSASVVTAARQLGYECFRQE